MLTSSWRLQSHSSRARLPLGSFFTSHLHLPDLLTEPLTCSVFYCTGKQKNTNAAPHFFRPLLASHGNKRGEEREGMSWDWERQWVKEGDQFHEGLALSSGNGSICLFFSNTSINITIENVSLIKAWKAAGHLYFEVGERQRRQWERQGWHMAQMSVVIALLKVCQT